MIRRPLILAVAVAILAGGSLLARQEPLLGPKPGAEVGAPDELGRALQCQGYVAVPLDRVGPRELVVTATVAGQRVRLLLDTGSTNTFLDRERTKRLSLEWRSNSADDPSPDGRWIFSKYCEVAGMEVGGLKIWRLRAFAYKDAEENEMLERCGDEPVDGLLGADVLTWHAGVIDYASNRLFLKPRAAPPPVPVRPDPGALVTRSPLAWFSIHLTAERAKEVKRVRLYVSEDRGRTWEHFQDYLPGLREIRFVPFHGGQYWFAVQLVLKDGKTDPPDLRGLAVIQKFYFAGRVEPTVQKGDSLMP